MKRAARITVTYDIMDDSDFERLNCHAESETIFEEDCTNQLKIMANTASQILIDKYNVELIYTTILSNMLHVPPELRKKPN